MELRCNFDDLIKYGEVNKTSIWNYRHHYHLSYDRWVHCYELWGQLINDFNQGLVSRNYFLNCMHELGLFAHEISGVLERNSQESKVFLQQHMDYLYPNDILFDMFYPPNKKLPPRALPRRFDAVDFWTEHEMGKVDYYTGLQFEKLFPHKAYIRNVKGLEDLPVHLYRFYEIMAQYPKIEDSSILWEDDFIFSFYLLIWPVLKRTGYAVQNLWAFVYEIADLLNSFTQENYVLVDCNHYYYGDSKKPYYCGRAFTTITAPDLPRSKFVIFNTVDPMDMSPFKLTRYKQGLEASGPPMETEEWETYINN